MDVDPPGRGDGGDAGSPGQADSAIGRSAVTTVDASTAEVMRELGKSLGRLLRAGDLIILTGPLGAGKTTLVQGIAQGLDVAGSVTSPTFVIAREHRARGDGPSLVHVDAYRLGDVAELDDLGLDVDLEDAVVAVEWGSGKAEILAPDRLDVLISRSDSDDRRTVQLEPVGPGWLVRGAQLAALAAEPGRSAALATDVVGRPREDREMAG